MRQIGKYEKIQNPETKLIAICYRRFRTAAQRADTSYQVYKSHPTKINAKNYEQHMTEFLTIKSILQEYGLENDDLKQLEIDAINNK